MRCYYIASCGWLWFEIIFDKLIFGHPQTIAWLFPNNPTHRRYSALINGYWNFCFQGASAYMWVRYASPPNVPTYRFETMYLYIIHSRILRTDKKLQTAIMIIHLCTYESKSNIFNMKTWPFGPFRENLDVIIQLLWRYLSAELRSDNINILNHVPKIAIYSIRIQYIMILFK